MQLQGVPQPSPPRRTAQPGEEQEAPSLEQLADKSPRVLFEVDTVFPFVLFTDRIIVDESKLTVLIGNFFKTYQQRSVLIEDVANIIVDCSYYFATVNIIDRHFLTQPITVKYILKNKAILLREFVVGLIIAMNNGVDLSQYDDTEVRKYIIQIGSASTLESED